MVKNDIGIIKHASTAGNCIGIVKHEFIISCNVDVQNEVCYLLSSKHASLRI